MLRLTEVASQSETFVKPALRKAKTKTSREVIGPQWAKRSKSFLLTGRLYWLLTAEFKPVIKQLDLLSIEHSEGPAKPKRRPPRTYDKNKLEAALQLVLQEEHPPSSFAKVAERLQVNNRHLRKMFPELSRSVAARCKQEREAIGAARIQSAGEDIQWAAHQLLRQGIYPSRRSVVLFMKANGKVPRHDILNRVLNRIGGEEAQVDTMKVSIEELGSI